jgi:hypothetical protein
MQLRWLEKDGVKTLQYLAGIINVETGEEATLSDIVFDAVTDKNGLTEDWQDVPVVGEVQCKKD